MAQSLTLKVSGLYTSVNELGSDLPEGALLKAENIDIIQDNIAEPRRGLERLANGFSNSADRADRIFFYKEKRFAHHGTLYSADTLSYYDSGWNALSGSYTAQTGWKLKTLQANQNLYWNSSTGVYKIDNYNSTPQLAGAYKGLDVQVSVSGSSGFLANNFRVSYRIVWGFKDDNDNLVLGAPSERASITNGAGADRDVDLDFSIPSGVTTDWIYQIYRSAQYDQSSGVVEPNDELQLVYESSPSSTDISNGYVQVTDLTPDALRAATIYTADSQEGIAYRNERPPLCKDFAVFRDVTFFGNITSKHRYYITLLAVGGTNGIAVNDTLYIDGITYTGKASETVASGEFAVVTTGSAAQNIADTAKSLVKVINRYSSSTVYAYYLSGPDDLPGKILIEERGIGGAAFVIRANTDTCWSPSGIPSAGNTETSTNDNFGNGIMWAKPFQPEHVPLVNQTRVGSEDSKILRIIPLREALYIFKEDGIYRLTGYYPNFDIELLDSSAVLIGESTPAILNNQIYCLTDQGVTVVAEGVKIISRPIEQDILELFALSLDNVKNYSFGVGHETDRKYYLYTIDNAADSYPTRSFVYNIFTNAWTEHIYPASAGCYCNNQLSIADPASEYIVTDRKSYTYLDYADFGFNTTITAITSTTINISAGSDLISVGDILYESSTKFAIITGVDSIASTVTVDNDPGFTLTTVQLLKAIATRIQWAPLTMANPGVQKQNHTIQSFFKSDYNGIGYLNFTTDLNLAVESVQLQGQGLGSWGLFTWGSQPWGGASRKRPLRQWIPRGSQRCSQITVEFTHAYGFSPWKLQGLSLHGAVGSERTQR